METAMEGTTRSSALIANACHQLRSCVRAMAVAGVLMVISPSAHAQTTLDEPSTGNAAADSSDRNAQGDGPAANGELRIGQRPVQESATATETETEIETESTDTATTDQSSAREADASASPPLQSETDTASSADEALEQSLAGDTVPHAAPDTPATLPIEEHLADMDAAGVDASLAHPQPTEAAAEALPLGEDSGLLSLGTTSSEHAGATSTASAMPAGVQEFLRVGGALAVVIGILIICSIVARRFNAGGVGGISGRAGRPSGVIEILARYPVARGQSLVLLKLDRRVLLLHQTKSEMSTLCEMTEARDVASLLARIEAGSRSAGGSNRFQKALEGANSRLLSRSARIETVDLTRRDQSRLLRSVGPSGATA